MTKMLSAKNPRTLAGYAMFAAPRRGRRRRCVRDRIASQPPSSREITDLVVTEDNIARISEIRNALVHGVNVVEFGNVANAFRTVLESLDVASIPFGSGWKAFNARYIQFMRGALTQVEGRREHEIPRWVVAAFAFDEPEEEPVDEVEDYERFLEAARPVAYRKASYLNAEFIRAAGDMCECWIDVAEGFRVRANIAGRSLRGLELSEGDEFLWSPETETAMLKPEETDTDERRELQEEITELQREFHEELKHLDTGLSRE